MVDRKSKKEHNQTCKKNENPMTMEVGKFKSKMTFVKIKWQMETGGRKLEQRKCIKSFLNTSPMHYFL